jgi:hypothetical protein
VTSLPLRWLKVNDVFEFPLACILILAIAGEGVGLLEKWVGMHPA